MNITTRDVLGELAHHQTLAQMLRERFPDEDQQTLADTLEGMSDLNDMLAEVARSIADDKCDAEACKLRIADLQLRAKRHEDRAAAKREVIASVMERAGLRKIVAADVTISLGQGKPKLVITNEAQVIAEGYGIQPDPVIDKVTLRAALEAGNEILGATLGNAAPQLTIRTK